MRMRGRPYCCGAQEGRPTAGAACRGGKSRVSEKLVFDAHDSPENLPAHEIILLPKTLAQIRVEKDRAKVRAWALANPEKKRDRDRRCRERKRARERPAKEAARAAKREATRERAKAAGRARYWAKREAALERGRAWRAAHPDQQRENIRRWKDENHDKVRADKRGRKIHRKKALDERLMKAQRGRCAYCRLPLGAGRHVDHITPKARGGSNRRSNLQLTCAPCNLSKGARDPIEFAQNMGRLL